MIWKLRFRDGRPLYVYLLLEFQSDVQRFMAVRVMAYVALFYQDLIKGRELTEEGKLPLVVPIVLYNGEERWWAPVELADLVEGGIARRRRCSGRVCATTSSTRGATRSRS